MIIVLLFVVCFTSCRRSFYPYSAKPTKEPFSLDLSRYKSPQLRDGQNANLELGMAISGGGSRASFFGLGVMLELEKLRMGGSSNILNEIDYFSTVSGGGFCAAYYIAQYAHHQQLYARDGETFSLNHIWHQSNEAKYNLPHIDLNSTFFKNVFIHNLFRPGKRLAQEIDSIGRSVLLENRYDMRGNPYRTLFLGDIFIDTAYPEQPTLPIFITNATFYENNTRLPMVPVLLDSLHVTGLYHPQVDFIGGADYIPLHYGVTASASFPGILMQIRFQTKDSSLIRIIDGGVSDNFGYKSMVDVYRRKPHKESQRLILIDASGQGLPSPISKHRPVGFFKVLRKMLYSGLESKYAESQEEVKQFFQNDSSFAFIGINNIRKHCEQNNWPVPAIINTNGLVSWPKVYDSLVAMIGEPINHNTKPEAIDSPDKFWLLFELAANVPTKLYAYPEESALLVLAGRVAVRLNEERLLQLVNIPAFKTPAF